MWKYGVNATLVTFCFQAWQTIDATGPSVAVAYRAQKLPNLVVGAALHTTCRNGGRPGYASLKGLSDRAEGLAFREQPSQRNAPGHVMTDIGQHPPPFPDIMGKRFGIKRHMEPAICDPCPQDFDGRHRVQRFGRWIEFDGRRLFRFVGHGNLIDATQPQTIAGDLDARIKLPRRQLARKNGHVSTLMSAFGPAAVMGQRGP